MCFISMVLWNLHLLLLYDFYFLKSTSGETFSSTENLQWLLYASVGAPAGRANGGTGGKWGKWGCVLSGSLGEEVQSFRVKLLGQRCLSILWPKLGFTFLCECCFWYCLQVLVHQHLWSLPLPVASIQDGIPSRPNTRKANLPDSPL